MRLILIVLLAACVANSQAAESVEERAAEIIKKRAAKIVEKWDIIGKLDYPADATLNPDKVSFHCVWIGKIRAQNALLRPRIVVNAAGEFEITRTPGDILGDLVKGRHRIAAYTDGRLSSVAEFTVAESPAIIKNIVLKFGEKNTHAVRFKVVHPETKKPLPGLTLRITLSPDAFADPALANFPITEVSTDEKGEALVEKLPPGIIEVDDIMHPYSMALADGDRLEPWCRMRTMELKAVQALKDAELPVIYRLDDGEAMYWGILEDQHGEPVREGTVLKFTLQHEGFGSSVKEPLVFKSTVGKGSILKTPIVKHGIYMATFENGAEFQTVYIEGMGTGYYDKRTPLREEKHK